MEINEILETWKAEVLNAVCLDGCHSICCSLNFDLNDEEHLRFLFGTKETGHMPSNSNGQPLFWGYSPFEEKFEGRKGMFRTNFVPGRDYCPQFDGKCKIYRHKSKSHACDSYPFGIDIKEKTVLYDAKCGAMTPGNILGLSSKLQKAGYELISTQKSSEKNFRKVNEFNMVAEIILVD